MTPALTIEIAPFSLADSVDEATILAASERLEREFLSGAEGYLGRALTRLPDGRWADIVLWRSAEDANAVMPRIPESPACGAYFGCMVGADPANPSAGITHATTVRAYGLLAPR